MFTLTQKGHDQGGLFLLQHDEPGHTQVPRCSRELSEGQESPRQGTWCPHCTSEVSTTQTQVQETPSARLHDRRHQSPHTEDDAAARKGLDHPSCLLWLPLSKSSLGTAGQTVPRFGNAKGSINKDGHRKQLN